MSQHESHAAVVKRLKRANGHLASVIDMLQGDRSCIDIAQQLQAVESAIHSAKKTLILDHISHCLVHERDPEQGMRELQTITKFL
ncbi:metal-sensing transcriptional repressor [Massilia sp. NP310]|uniref:metal-sensing transcriptional repressor n=1 Tax=Massilia sp. NP310 TaxID=2861282 RepID=UPI001C63A93F|nr:metal-sensing transcriptional repressor [Massilia sp. NP310]QYG02787.1 metal-sensing transcriptional repressor [Massilia sp. NP310]